MARTNSFKINGYTFGMTAGTGDNSDGVVITTNMPSLDNEDFIFALSIARELYPYFKDFAWATENYHVYTPTLHDVSDNNLKIRETFIKLLVETSSNEAQEHQQRMQNDTWGKRKPSRSNGYIYLIRAVTPNSHYKIGLSKKPVERIETLGVQLPFPVEPIHQFPTNDMKLAEKALHDRYADKRINGEWFALTDDDVAAICAIAEMNHE